MSYGGNVISSSCVRISDELFNLNVKLMNIT